VAPPYREDLLGLRLTDAAGKKTVLAGGRSIKGWLPGKTDLPAEPFRIPADLKPGAYDLSLAVLENATTQPIVRLAIAGRDPEGWYPLSQLNVEPAAPGASAPAP